MLVGLVGCVKSKQLWAAPARELYRSALFRGRRAWVERPVIVGSYCRPSMGSSSRTACKRPYDETLRLADRCASVERQVLQALEDALGDLSGVVIELHAGMTYLRTAWWLGSANKVW
jgi:uncharacterized protein DUF6884